MEKITIRILNTKHLTTKNLQRVAISEAAYIQLPILNVLIIVYIQMYLNVFSEQIPFRSLALQTAQKFVYFPDFIDLLK